MPNRCPKGVILEIGETTSHVPGPTYTGTDWSRRSSFLQEMMLPGEIEPAGSYEHRAGQFRKLAPIVQPTRPHITHSCRVTASSCVDREAPGVGGVLQMTIEFMHTTRDTRRVAVHTGELPQCADRTYSRMLKPPAMRLNPPARARAGRGTPASSRK
jgi:hypothetical protein